MNNVLTNLIIRCDIKHVYLQVGQGGIISFLFGKRRNLLRDSSCRRYKTTLHAHIHEDINAMFKFINRNNLLIYPRHGNVARVDFSANYC